MLKKVVSIKNVGKFVDYQASGKVNFSKMALIYAENGRGKTTLSTIFRSLGTNRAEYILGRRSLGISDDENITISILTDDGMAQFDSATTKAWDKVIKNIEIFDSIFVNENVFSGDYVDIEHQRGLYLFVVGEDNVERAKKIEEIDQKIRDLNTKIREQETEVKNLIQGNLSVPDFVSLPNDLNGQIALEQKEKELRDFKESAEISQKAYLRKIELPSIVLSEIVNIMSQTIESLSSEAEKRTLEHIKKYHMLDGETWLRDGVTHLQDDTCPFCGQDIRTSNVINAFRNYFDESYSELKKHIGDNLSIYQATFSESKLRDFQKDVLENNTLIEFWKDFISLTTLPQIDFDVFQEMWDRLRSELTLQFEEKLRSPLEKVNISESLSTTVSAYEILHENVKAYNEIGAEVNSKIKGVKDKIALADEKILNTEIMQLRNQLTRYSSAGVSECNKLTSLNADKVKLEDEKTKEKATLDNETKSMLDKYQKKINYHLDQIGVSFRIEKTKPSYKGGKPSSSYQIVINGVPVGLGEREVLEQPGFKNTLSDGDKTTLAFGLFLAKLDFDEKLSEKIIVFDDPVNSLDRYRKDYTREQIERVSKIAKQVIAMSHDQYFLRDLWERLDRSNTTTLWIARSGNSSHIQEWNIEQETDSDYIRNYRQITKYLDLGSKTADDMRSVCRCIRPALEGYLRQKYPLDFYANEWLGEFIRKVRHSSSTDRLYPMMQNNIIDEIETVCEYSGKYHHKQNLNYENEPIDDDTLKSYVNRALKIIHG